MTGHDCSSNESPEGESKPRGKRRAFFRGSGSTELAVHETLPLLANDERYRLVRYLIEQTPRTVTVDQVAEALVTRSGDSPAGPGSDPLESIRIAVVHRHVPKLEAAGVITYRAESGTLEYHRDPTLESLVRCIEDMDHE